MRSICPTTTSAGEDYIHGRSDDLRKVRLRLHALADNLGNSLRTLPTPEPIKDWSLTSLKERLIDRREGSEPWPLCCFPDGRGRLPTTTVPGDFAAHCRTTAAATTSVTRSIVMHSRAIDARTAPKCQEKRSDQTFEHRFGGLESRLPAVLRIWASSHFRIGLPLNPRLNKHNDKGVIHVHVCLAGRKRPRGHDYSR